MSRGGLAGLSLPRAKCFFYPACHKRYLNKVVRLISFVLTFFSRGCSTRTSNGQTGADSIFSGGRAASQIWAPLAIGGAWSDLSGRMAERLGIGS